MDEALKEKFEKQGYSHLREINGVICGILPFFSTVGIVVGLSDIGYVRRYCYKYYWDALDALATATTTDEHFSGPWLKCKGRMGTELLDLWNPNLEETAE